MTIPSSLNFVEGNELPSAPEAGRRRLYAKAGGWYDMDSDAVETLLLSEAAADLLYDPINAASDAITAHLEASNPHGQYLTQAEGDAAYDAIGAAAAAQSAAQSYADGLVVGLWDDRGNYDASSNAFPSSGGSGSAGAILKGDVWTASAGGTLGGQAVEIGDIIRALTDTPGQTASNWAIQEHNLGYVALNAASNLSDLANAGTARTNLGLGTAAVKNTGTSGNNVPLLDGANTWSATQTLDAFTRFAGATSAYPALKRSGAELQARLADDSAYADFRANAINAAYLGSSGNAGFSTWLISGSGSYLFTPSDIGGSLSLRNGTNPVGLALHNTYTDGSNYERQVLKSGSGYFEWAAETAGTGADDIGLRLTPAGTGKVRIGGGIALNGDPGGANSCVVQQFVKTGLGDAAATAVITVTVPNGNHSAVLKMRFISTNGSTDANESTRTAEASVVIARTTGADTAKTDVSIGVAGQATVSGGATHTLAYATSGLTGASGATQTFTVNVTLDDSGNVGSNEVMIFAWLHNRNANGVTMAAA